MWSGLGHRWAGRLAASPRCHRSVLKKCRGTVGRKGHPSTAPPVAARYGWKWDFPRSRERSSRGTRAEEDVGRRGAADRAGAKAAPGARGLLQEQVARLHHSGNKSSFWGLSHTPAPAGPGGPGPTGRASRGLTSHLNACRQGC